MASQPYQASLYRGWDWVRLSYEIEGEELVVRTRSVWRGRSQKRVAIKELSDDVHRVWARQGAYRWAMTALLIAAMAVALDFAASKMMSPGKAISMLTWSLAGAAAALAFPIAYGTRSRREWARIRGRTGPGVYILKNPGDERGFENLLRAVKRGIEAQG